MPGVEVVAVCDAYKGRAERAKSRTGGRATIVQDYHEILAMPGVDAVFIVTPDHWHKTMAVEALAAKKDIYLEKPMSYSIEDGLGDSRRREARSDRIVQVGSQGVSGAGHGQGAGAGQGGQDRAGDDGARRLQPQQRRRRVAVPDSPRCEPADGELGSVPRTRAEAAVRSEALLPVALLLGLLGRHRDGPVRPPRLVDALLDRREDAQVHRRHRRELPLQEDARSAGHGERAAALPGRLHREPVVHVQQRARRGLGLEILGTKGSLLLRGGTLTFTPEPARENNRWVVDSWPEALEKAYYDDPKVQAIESPSTWPGQIIAGEESWQPEGRDAGYMHIENFFASVRTRHQPVEDALFGHRAASCAHMVNQSIRDKRMVEWDFAAEKTT